MKELAEFIQPLLYSIEFTVLKVHDEFPQLKGKDIETVFEKLTTYFKASISKKDMKEPYTPTEPNQVLIEELLNVIDNREEAELDLYIVNNPDIRHGEHLIPSLNHLYIMAFKRLKNSAKFWRKEGGPNAYVRYLSNFIPRGS